MNEMEKDIVKREKQEEKKIPQQKNPLEQRGWKIQREPLAPPENALQEP